jgi:demethylmenaquinone methyltransferase/2-methoxy-6-polyprenyl-1,4-benzoquinol methylase
MSNPDNKTHFGYERVNVAEKESRVREVFDSVAGSYDIMNDVMSLGIHRLWKWFTVSIGGVHAGQNVLDVAAGSGDLSKRFADRVGPKGRVIVTDINGSMLQEGRSRLINDGFLDNIHFVQTDAETLPFKSNYFDCISIGFGLRNVTDKETALASMYRCTKPGGKLLVLEFSKPVNATLRRIYDAWSLNMIPALGQLIAGDRKSYQYLVESIRVHPGQEELKSMMLTAGFDEVCYHNLTGGIVAVHLGYKY